MRSRSRKRFGDLFPAPPPDPTECPDCGSQRILRICYGLPGPEMRERALQGEIVLGGCIFRTPRWCCKECLHHWPEDAPSGQLHGTEEWREKYVAEQAAEYAQLSQDASGPPLAGEPSVANYWERSDGRKVFLVRFEWGVMRVEKQLHLLAHGGTPVYTIVAGFPPLEVGFHGASYLGSLAAMRFETRRVA